MAAFAEPPASLSAEGDFAFDAEADAAADGLRTLQLLSAGAEALAEGRAEEALLLLEAAPLGTPADADTHFLRGVAHLDLRDPQAALAELQAAAALEPDDVPTRCVLARAWHATGNLPAAAAELERALALEPDDAHLHTLLGHLLLEQESFGPAWDELLLAVELDPAEADAHRGLALIFEATGDLAHAEQAWRQAVTLEPGEALLHAGLAAVLRSAGRPGDALASYQRALELQPDNGVLLANLASSLVALGRLAEGREAYERAFAQPLPEGTSRAVISCNYGALLERLGDLDGARDAWEEALAADPELPEPAEALGLLALDGGAEEEACALLQQALDVGGLTAEALLRLALLHEQLGHVEEARHCGRLLASADTGDAAVAFRHAQLQVLSQDSELRDPRAAIGTLRDLADGLPAESAGPVWSLLGEALAQEGALQSAYEAATRALQLTDPGHPAWARYSALREQYLSGLVGR